MANRRFVPKVQPQLLVHWFRPVIFLAAILLFTGCAQSGQMIEQPRYDPLEQSDLFADGRSARPLIPGTVPYTGDAPVDSPVSTGLDENGEPYQGFPVEVNLELVEEGQERYTIFCVPCHGPAGEGNGRAVAFGVPEPPSLLGENARTLSSGEIYNIITNGQGNMFPYGYRVKSSERWAVIAYVRALQLTNGEVDPAQLSEDDIQQIGSQP